MDDLSIHGDVVGAVEFMVSHANDRPTIGGLAICLEHLALEALWLDQPLVASLIGAAHLALIDS